MTNQTEPYAVVIDRFANVHAHLREIPLVGPLINYSVAGGIDAILAMPNLNAPLTDAQSVLEYMQALRQFSPPSHPMTFISTAYVTERTSSDDILGMVALGIEHFKVYPRHRTTKSQDGVVDYYGVIRAFREAAIGARDEMGKRIFVHLHPEHPSMLFDDADAEFAFLPILRMLVETTEAVVVSEHGTDLRCIRHWKDLSTSGRFYVTLTAHHLAADEDSVRGDVRAVCKPPIKRVLDRELLCQLVKEDHPWVLAGLDDAPHPASAKHVDSGGCACGSYTAPFGIQLYAHALGDLAMTAEGAEVFQRLISRNARAAYGLPAASGSVRLVKKPCRIPLRYPVVNFDVAPFWAGKTIDWSLENVA